MRWPWNKPAAVVPQQTADEAPALRVGFFSTDVTPVLENALQKRARLAALLKHTFQRGIEDIVPVSADGSAFTGEAVAMDSAYPDLASAKLVNSTGGFMPVAQLEWYAQQGFIGWQTCAMLAQNWLIDKACGMPAQDAIRHGWDLNIGDDVDPKVFEAIKKADRRMKLKKNARQYVKMGRTFGVRHCMFLVDGIDYEAPFNPDGVRPGSYRGMTQIDPYWIAPILDGRAASDPAAPDFYEPTWWQISGRRIHRTHLAIMRCGDEVADILKPSYMYGGIPIPQKVFERVYAAERTANEAPMLAMSKRLTVLKMDTTMAMANMPQFAAKMNAWLSLQNNFGAKIIGEGEEISQYDTNLAGLDETVMTQYQLVAAAANVPVTKLMGTTPKGFNSTGEYEESSYHEELESIQEHDLMPLLEGHYQRLMLSEIVPKFGISTAHVDISFKPCDSPTAEELAALNKTKADTDAVLANAGAIDGFDIRQRLINDADSGYTGIEDVVDGGVGDREAEKEAAAIALQAPINEKAAINDNSPADKA